MSLHSIFYFIFVQVSLLVPGYVLIKKLRFLDKNPGVELVFAYLTTIIFFAGLATLDYAFDFNPVLSRVLCWAVILVSVFIFIQQRYFKSIWQLRFPILCLVLMSLLSSAFIGLTFKSSYAYIPDPVPEANTDYNTLNVKALNVAQTQANDNYIPYRQAQFFINRSDPAKDSFIGEWGVNFFERTPLMGTVTANYFNLFNDKPPIAFTWSTTSRDPDQTYLKFQIIAGILNALFIIPAFFLVAKFFNKKTAVITCLFLVISQFFLYNAVFTWPKSFVAFFILLSWLLLLEKKMRYTVLAGIASGLAYLAHDLAVLYIGASVLFLLYNKRFKEILVFGLGAIVFAAPWLLTADFIYHQPSSFIYYPISTTGIPQTSQLKRTIHQFLYTSTLRLLDIRLENVIYLLSPYQLFTSEGGNSILRRLWSLGLYSIPGSLGMGLIIPTLLGVFKKFRRNIDFWILALGPVLFETIVIGWPKGLGALHFAEAITVLLSGLGIFYLLKLNNKTWLLLAFIVNCTQLVFFIGYSYKFAVGNWFTNSADLIRLAVITGIVLLCGVLVYKTLRGERSLLVG